jgi:Delta7-sterol 5-desaturase
MNAYFLNLDWLSAVIFLVSLFFVRAMVFAGGAQLWIQLSPSSDQHRIVAKTTERLSYKKEILRGILVISLDAVFVASMIYFELLKIDPNPLWFETILVFFSLFIWFEIYFYFSHRAIHHPKLFWIHAAHHEGKGTSPFTSLSFSLWERGILLIGAIGIPALFSHWISLSLQGIGIYFLVNYILNVNGHLGRELFSAKFLLKFPWLASATSHGLHHLRYKGNYGLFTQSLDRLLDTDFKDYEEVVKKVKSGIPAK